MTERNVLGGPLEPCSSDPPTGFFRDGDCSCRSQDEVRHLLCAVMTTAFLEHQRAAGNDLVSPRPEWDFPGLRPGDRWCVVVERWLQAFADGVVAPVVLAATHERVLELISLDVLAIQSVDVPDDPGELIDP